ncbi:hypothetical protein [Thermosulfurimonas dismutans]|uniref:MotA/TolQ/ExbB proton channel domain-containing protein n=1 Tax=Thermosulfurimonas dismutans TaxID=999894 RepID=A0A179D3I1_9BACT|nr:hypothetical protein [Thermosulfurimonas dismutans]OAQ20615.1 hypothetical protein TDIS_1230 [Thermosulfurimonas dismutans]
MKANFNKLADFSFILISVVVLMLTLFNLPYNLVTILRFLWGYIGPTTVLLVPMAVFVLAVVFILPFGRLRSKDVTTELLRVICFLAPLLGFIGTLLGFSSGTLGFKHGFDTKAVAQMAVRTGQGISSTLFGIVIFALSGLILRYGVREDSTNISHLLAKISHALEEVSHE